MTLTTEPPRDECDHDRLIDVDESHRRRLLEAGMDLHVNVGPFHGGYRYENTTATHPSPAMRP